MENFAFVVVLPILLTIVESNSVTNVSNNNLSSWNPQDYESYLDSSKFGFFYLDSQIKPPNITIEQPRFIPDFPSIDEITNIIKDISKNAFEKIKKTLTVFYEKQIAMFDNVSLTIFDDNGSLIDFVLDLPDFNFLHLIPDLNKDVTIKLYTKELGNDFDILEVGNETALKNSHFDKERHTYIITHGFMASSDGLSCTLVRDALLSTTDSNIVTVNWSPLSTGSYSVARLFVPYVGEHIGKLINFLYENGLDPDRTTLIGHSLGAQIMGYAGQTANKKVNHTIGLDPAWPLFVFLPHNYRLSPEDAQYVEVIHTNGGLLGSPYKLGHYNFYPNGGTLQKGCSTISACSHGRSYIYLAEQIANSGDKFPSIKCESYSNFKEHNCTEETALMGGISFSPANEGDYYLETNGEEPFSLSTPWSEIMKFFFK